MEQTQNLKYGRYQVLRTLGNGAMGIVYEAHDPQIDRHVALKVLRQDRLTSDTYIRRFIKEAVAIGRLSHPRIVTVYDAGQDNEAVYIAMEFLEGAPLDAVMAKRRPSLSEVVDIGCQVAEALDYAHSRGIVHRDVKPSNLLMRTDGLIKITDFGIAHIEDPAVTKQTQAGEILGTPAYMSPEQVMGKEVDGRSDLFSLGVILYEMSTGQKPFRGPTLTSILREIVDGLPRIPEGIQPELPPGFRTVIMKCLSKRPEDRYQTGRELAEALKGCLEPPRPTPQPEPVPETLPPHRGFSLKFLAIPSALVLAGLLAYGTYQYMPKRTAGPGEPPATTVGSTARSTLPPTTQPHATVPSTSVPPTTIPPATVSDGKDTGIPTGTTVSGKSDAPAAASSGSTAGSAAGGAEKISAAAVAQDVNVATAAGSTSGSTGKEPEDPFQKAMAEGTAAFERKQYETAQQSFSTALGFKSDSNAYFYLLSTMIELHRDNQAKDTFDKASSLFPEAPGLYAIYARYLVAQGRTQEAGKVMDRAHALMPNDATIRQWREYIASLNKPAVTATTVATTTTMPAKMLPPYPMSTRTRKVSAAAEREKAQALFTFAKKENKRLQWDDCLAGKAVQRAKDMIAAGYFDHNAPNSATNPAWKLISSCRKVANGGENLAQGYHSAETIHQELMKSSTHRRNILSSKYRYMGVGCSEYICVELFAGP
ncbi:MAG: protein kinase [Syntrophobacteraceae bacterium]|nr:protein kinase [Desulfobacteraceae bacterium]